jgi:tetratricopeptide (TPR) repeat protein
MQNNYVKRIARLTLWLATMTAVASIAAELDPVGVKLLAQPWFELRSAHFNTFSCGPQPEAAKVAARLEQFREAYASLAGAGAVASPPIVVVAFPTHSSMLPYLPQFQGKPMSLAAYFHHDSDENLIVLSLSETGNDTMQTIFHEYTHLLLRHNDPFWPPWLEEGMAEVYSTFQPLQGQGLVRIGGPLPHHLELLANEQWLPLAELFAVSHSSPTYNEKSRQGIFYAESWLLTHYLMLGDNEVLKSRFGKMTPLLRAGEAPGKAFTDALGVSAAVIEKALHKYFLAGHFGFLKLAVRADFSSPAGMAMRPLGKAEVCYRLGEVLFRINRTEAAERYFETALKIAPRSPLGYEGMGLLAEERREPAEAVRKLSQAIALGSTNFLTHYTLAQAEYALTSNGNDRYSKLPPERAEPIRKDLKRSLQLMPAFAASQHLLGFFEMVQGEDLGAAEEYLKHAVALEPENAAYAIALAQAQIARYEDREARATLQPLTAPYVDKKIRQHAQEMLEEISKPKKRQ